MLLAPSSLPTRRTGGSRLRALALFQFRGLLRQGHLLCGQPATAEGIRCIRRRFDNQSLCTATGVDVCGTLPRVSLRPIHGPRSGVNRFLGLSCVARHILGRDQPRGNGWGRPLLPSGPAAATQQPDKRLSVLCSLGLNGTVNNTEAQAAQGGPLASRLRWDLFLCCGSQDSAYYRTYRRQLRPSSRHEPRHPPWQAVPEGIIIVEATQFSETSGVTAPGAGVTLDQEEALVKHHLSWEARGPGDRCLGPCYEDH